VKRAIVEQHRLLESLFAESREALAGEEAEAMGRVVASLRDALEAHFELEDRLYHPPIRALRPQHAETLRSIAGGHARFLVQLAAIVEGIGDGALPDARAWFEELTREFAAHEALEEGLLRAIDLEAEAGRG
jgi:hypothetical protein